MMNRFHLIMVGCTSAALAVVILVFTAAPAAAYIDPGSTSMLVQFVVGAVAAALVLGRRLLRGTAAHVTAALRGVFTNSSGGPTGPRYDQ
jgi:hypothetical protein